MKERIAVVDTPSPGEVIAVFRNEDGTLRNVTIRDTTLQDRLRATPTHVVNPARAPLEEEVFGAAEAQLAEDAQRAAAAANG